MFDRYTEEARRAIFFARYEASQFGSREITPEHLLLGLMRDSRRVIVDCCRSPESVDSMRSQIEAQSTHGEKIAVSVDLPLSGASKRVLAYAADEALRLEHKNVTPLHLIAGLLREEKSLAAKLLRQEITIEQVRAKLQRSAGTRGETMPEPRPDSVLSQTCRDLTAAVEGHPFPPLVDRDRELNTVIQVLAKRNGNNPVLIGEPGVGKTAIIEGLAQRMVNRQVPEFLAAKRLLMLNPESFMETPRNRRTLRDQFAALLEEIAEDSNVILVIDGLFEPAAQAGGPFAGVLGALLASISFGTLQTIATGTPAAYREAVQKDPAIERHMRSIEILPSDEKDAVQIFLGVKPRYEEYHGVVYDEAAIETAVAASVQFMPRRHLPEKALDLLDEAGSRIRLREPDEVRECREHLRFVAQQLKAAIAGGESEKIRALVEEERQTREKLILLQQKYKLNDPSPRKVTREEIEELIAERAGLPLEAVRARLGKK